MLIALFLFATFAFSQDYKNDISVVQYSAEFVKDAEMDLSKFKNYNTFTFYMGKDPSVFKQDNVKFVYINHLRKR